MNILEFQYPPRPNRPQRLTRRTLRWRITLRRQGGGITGPQRNRAGRRRLDREWEGVRARSHCVIRMATNGPTERKAAVARHPGRRNLTDAGGLWNSGRSDRPRRPAHTEHVRGRRTRRRRHTSTIVQLADSQRVLTATATPPARCDALERIFSADTNGGSAPPAQAAAGIMMMATPPRPVRGDTASGQEVVRSTRLLVAACWSL